VDQKSRTFREFRKPFPHATSANPRRMYARVPQMMAQFVLKIEKLSHIMGTAPILEMARAYCLRPRLWLLVYRISVFFIGIYYQLVYAKAIIPSLSFCRMTLGSAFRLCPTIKQLDYEHEISIAR